MTPLVELSRVDFAYEPQRVLFEGLDFHLDPGERVGLVGGNGCGKTTLLHLIVGLVKPRNGSVKVFGRPRRAEREFREVRRRVGLVFQDADDQLFCPTVLEDVAFGPCNLGRSPEQAREVARKTLEALGLLSFEDRVTYRLSGGEKRLVALATVLAMEPEVLLLDEPASGLDEESRSRMTEVLARLPQAMLLVTHERDLMRKLTQRVVCLRAGRLAENRVIPRL
jgi:cobalt/nickel transport system ATP-binding protein